MRKNEELQERVMPLRSKMRDAIKQSQEVKRVNNKLTHKNKTRADNERDWKIKLHEQT